MQNMDPNRTLPRYRATPRETVLPNAFEQLVSVSLQSYLRDAQTSRSSRKRFQGLLNEQYRQRRES